MNWSSFLEKNYRIHQMAKDAASSGKLSTLDKDLILQHLRDLYEWMHENTEMNGNNVSEHISDAQDLKEEEKWSTGNITFTEPEPIVPEVELQEEEPVIHQIEIEIPVVQHVVETVQVPEPEPVPVSVPEVPVMIEPEPSVPSAAEKPADIPVAQPKSEINHDSYENLFGDIRIQDLSDKLALQKIPDLTRAMGINEKILTIQELFKNNQELFNKTITDLNTLSSFEDARQYLIQHVIEPMDWTADNKVKKAANFIRLIRRRFV